jgi:hypothetical protein
MNDEQKKKALHLAVYGDGIDGDQFLSELTEELEAAKNTYQRRERKRNCRAQIKGKRRVRKTFEKKEEEAEWMFLENFFERYLH